MRHHLALSLVPIRIFDAGGNAEQTLWFAERHKHSWLKELDRKSVDLGKGKRMIVRGGKLDTKFNITVPGNLDAGV